MISELWIPLAGTMMIPITVIGAILARGFSKRAQTPPSLAQFPADVTMRLERMEQAIDSIAVEVERISEAQRFTARLLAGRTDQANVPPS